MKFIFLWALIFAPQAQAFYDRLYDSTKFSCADWRSTTEKQRILYVTSGGGPGSTMITTNAFDCGSSPRVPAELPTTDNPRCAVGYFCGLVGPLAPVETGPDLSVFRCQGDIFSNHTFSFSRTQLISDRVNLGEMLAQPLLYTPSFQRGENPALFAATASERYTADLRGSSEGKVILKVETLQDGVWYHQRFFECRATFAPAN